MTINTSVVSRRTILAFGAGIVALTAFAQAAQAQSTAYISSADAFARQQSGELILVDIRTPPEWAQTGVARDALKIDMQDPEFVSKLVALRQQNPEKEIGLICRSSSRSSYAQTQLSQAGFDRLYSVDGGMAGNGQAKGWINEGLPVVGCC